MAKKNEIEIIRVLIENQEEELNISKVSEYSSIDYKNTYFILKGMEKEGLIELKVFGKNKRAVFKKKVHPLIFETEYERKKKRMKNKNLLILTKRLSELKFPFIVLLFGSYAKGTLQKGSDIDLLIVCEENREKEIQETLDLFPLAIHPTFTTFEGFIIMLKTKEFNVVSEAVKNNIILIGIEDYYRLLENAE